MPGLAGVYDPGADAAEIDRVLRRMRNAMEIPAWPCTAHTAVGPGVGCLHLRRAGPNDPLRICADDDPRGWLVLDGELYNAARGDTPADDSDARFCLSRYASEGESFVRQLNGQFNLVLYRAAERSLLIATDRYGYRPLFLARCGARALFATEMKAILAALETTPSVDGIGVLELLLQGYALGDRTWLEPIRVVDAGTLLDVTPGGISQRRYFRLRFEPGDASRSCAGFVMDMATKLACATERMTCGPERIGVLLSGGLDSRSVLLAARHPLAATFTFGAGASRDVRYATELAQLAGVSHLHFPYDPGYLGRVLSPVVWRTEGLLPFATATFTSFSFHPRIAAHADALLYGHCGDVLTGAHLRPDVLVERSRSRMIERLLRRQQTGEQAAVRRILDRGFYRRHASRVLDAMRATFTDIDQNELADVADVWDMENRQRRGTFHSPAVDRYRFEVRAPFLDNDLVDHLLQAPVRWRFQQIAYKRMLVRTFPQAAGVPWAYTGRPIRTHLAADLVDIAHNYLAKRLRRWWTTSDAALPPDQFRNLAADLRADARIPTVLRAFVASPWFPGDIFDRNGIEDVLRLHYGAGADLPHTIGMLATLATAFRLLLFERPDTMPAEAQPTA